MDIQIKKAKLVKDNKLEVGFTRSDNGETVYVNERHNAVAHPDLLAALASLRVHLGIISECIEPPKSIKKYPVELVEKLKVTAYSIGGKDDEGFVLTGQKILSTGKALIMNTPFTRFEEDEESVYRYTDDLQKCLDAVETEVMEYLNGKHAPDPQMEMAFTAGEEN